MGGAIERVAVARGPRLFGSPERAGSDSGVGRPPIPLSLSRPPADSTDPPAAGCRSAGRR